MRHVTNIKKALPIKDSELTVIILNATTTNKHSNAIRPNMLLKDGKSLLRKQIDTIEEVAPHCEIIVVTGENSQEIYNKNPNLKAKYVENERFYETNTMRSLCIGLMASLNKHVLVIYGDRFFTSDLLVHILKDESVIVTESSDVVDNSKVGVITENEKVSSIAYGLLTKWSQIALFSGEELITLRGICFDSSKWNWYVHEAINYILNKNGIFRAHPHSVIEVNNNKDIERVNKCLK